MASLVPPRAKLVDFNWSTRCTLSSDKLAAMERTVVILSLEVETEDGERPELEEKVKREQRLIDDYSFSPETALAGESSLLQEDDTSMNKKVQEQVAQYEQVYDKAYAKGFDSEASKEGTSFVQTSRRKEPHYQNKDFQNVADQLAGLQKMVDHMGMTVHADGSIEQEPGQLRTEDDANSS